LARPPVEADGAVRKLGLEKAGDKAGPIGIQDGSAGKVGGDDVKRE